MAETKLTPLLQTLSGELGGFTFRQTQNGTVVANPATRRNTPPTPEQTQTRLLFTQTTKAWGTLSDAQRRAWNAFATRQYPFDADRNGQGPNGQAVFNKLNWYRLLQQLPILQNPPTTTIPVPVITIQTAETGTEDELALLITHQARIGIDKFLLEATPPLTPGTLSPSPSSYTLVKGPNPNSLVTAAAPGTEYRVSQIRYPVPEGARYAIRVTVLTTEGLTSRPTTLLTTKTIV